MTAVAHDLRPVSDDSVEPDPTRPLRLAPASSPRSCSEAPISRLTVEEERLAYQAYLGDLHPTHAARLAAVTDELDRRWQIALG